MDGPLMEMGETQTHKPAAEQISEKYKQTLARFPKKDRSIRIQNLEDTIQTLNQKLSEQNQFKFEDKQRAVLKLKVAQHFEFHEQCDPNTLFDAIIETPNFLDQEKNLRVAGLLDLHEQKTLLRIAEARKRRADVEDKKTFNPWENLFTTKSGNYYVARLLNMPHLEDESAYMKHCVGTSESYINRIKQGEIEILSLRKIPKINPESGKLEGDVPVMTIEYNLKTGVVAQMKEVHDKYLSPSDPYFDDVIDILKQLPGTIADNGKPRIITKISGSELQNIRLKNYSLFTENGIVSLQEFNPDSGVLVFKTGSLKITPKISPEDTAKIVQISSGVKYNPQEIARVKSEIKNGVTKLYIGPVFPGIFKSLPENCQIYLSFPEKLVKKETLTIGGENSMQIQQKLDESDISLATVAKNIMKNKDFKTQEAAEQIRLIRLKVKDLGLDNTATTDQIYTKARELGLELCPAEVGPYLRLKYQDQPSSEWLHIAMEPIFVTGNYPMIFVLSRSEDGLLLNGHIATDNLWSSGDEFIFSLI